MSQLIRVSDDTYERLRKHSYELHRPFGKVIDILLDGYDAGDPRTPDQIARDEHAAQVEDTQASDRP